MLTPTLLRFIPFTSLALLPAHVPPPSTPHCTPAAVALPGVRAGSPDRRRHRPLFRLAAGVTLGGTHRSRFHLLPVLPHVEARPLLGGEGQAHDAAVPPHVPARDRWRQEDHGERSLRFRVRGGWYSSTVAAAGDRGGVGRGLLCVAGRVDDETRLDLDDSKYVHREV